MLFFFLGCGTINPNLALIGHKALSLLSPKLLDDAHLSCEHGKNERFERLLRGPSTTQSLRSGAGGVRRCSSVLICRIRANWSLRGCVAAPHERATASPRPQRASVRNNSWERCHARAEHAQAPKVGRWSGGSRRSNRRFFLCKNEGNVQMFAESLWHAEQATVRSGDI